MTKLSNSDLTIDTNRLVDILSLADGDIAFLTKLIDTFERNADQAMNELEQSRQSQDFDRIRRLSHKLKGMSAELGATTLQSIFGSIEDDSNILDLSTHSQMDFIEDRLRATLLALKEVRDHLGTNKRLY